MPKKFVFEGRSFIVSNDFNTGNSITLTGDFAGDGKTGTLMGFQAVSDDEEKQAVDFIALIVENKIKPGIIISGADYFNKIELKDIDKDGLPEILFWSQGGAHCTNLDIYKYSKGKMKQLFSNLSPCGIDFIDINPPTIKIARERWDKSGWSYGTANGDYLWEVWQWDGKIFQYRRNLSTTCPLSVEDLEQRLVNRANQVYKGK